MWRSLSLSRPFQPPKINKQLSQFSEIMSAKTSHLLTRALLWLALLEGGVPSISKSIQSWDAIKWKLSKRTVWRIITDVIGVQIVEVLPPISTSKHQNSVESGNVIWGMHVTDWCSWWLRHWDPTLIVNVKTMNIISSVRSALNPASDDIDMAAEGEV